MNLSVTRDGGFSGGGHLYSRQLAGFQDLRPMWWSAIDFTLFARHTDARMQDTTTEIVHYRNWYGRLHAMVVHTKKVTSDHKRNVQYQKWSQSQIQFHTFIANVLKYKPLSLVGQNLNNHNFLPSYQNWVLLDFLTS